MIEILALIFMAFLFGGVTGYREVEILCSRLSWLWVNIKRRLYKFANQNDVGQKNKDSFHISNGFAFLIVANLFSLVLYYKYNLSWWTIPVNTILFWVWMMHVRNVFMHVIIPICNKDNPNFRPWYLVPIFGVLLDRFYNKK